MADISLFHRQLGENRLLRNSSTKVNTVQEPFLLLDKISKSILPILSGFKSEALSSQFTPYRNSIVVIFLERTFQSTGEPIHKTSFTSDNTHSYTCYSWIIKSQKKTLTTRLNITESFKTNCYIFISTLSSAS